MNHFKYFFNLCSLLQNHCSQMMLKTFTRNLKVHYHSNQLLCCSTLQPPSFYFLPLAILLDTKAIKPEENIKGSHWHLKVIMMPTLPKLLWHQLCKYYNDATFVITGSTDGCHWPPLMVPVMTKLASWWPSGFSAVHNCHLQCLSNWYIQGLVHNCGNSIADALELPQSCAKTSIS